MARRIAPVRSTAEVNLDEASVQRGLLGRVMRRGAGRAGQDPAVLGLGSSAVEIESRPSFRGRLEIPLRAVRRALVDDGVNWAYATATCRFAVYDRRADGSGTGALVGPLWSNAAKLLPESCPVLEVAPVPELAPNVALILEPCVPAPPLREQSPGDPRGAEGVAIVLLRAREAEQARELLSTRFELRDLDLEDLEYLNRPTRVPREQPGDASAASA